MLIQHLFENELNSTIYPSPKEAQDAFEAIFREKTLNAKSIMTSVGITNTIEFYKTTNNTYIIRLRKRFGEELYEFESFQWAEMKYRGMVGTQLAVARVKEYNEL